MGSRTTAALRVTALTTRRFWRAVAGWLLTPTYFLVLLEHMHVDEAAGEESGRAPRSARLVGLAWFSKEYVSRGSKSSED